MHAFFRTRHIISRRYNVLNRCQNCHKCIRCLCNANLYTATCNYRTWNDLHSKAPGLNLLANENVKRNYIFQENYNSIYTRNFSLSVVHLEKTPLKPSSQVEVTVQELKDQKQSPAPVPAKAVKKPLKQRIKDELMHYYHGFRLLFIDIKITYGLFMRVLNGYTLTRREYKLLTRTVGDMFRLVPFSVFILVPFAELLLPLVVKLFPGMLPSTFESASVKEDKIKQSLKVKIEMAKFLQQTLDTMAVQHKDRSSDKVKEFTAWFLKVRTSGEEISTDEIIKYSKLFEDEITLDSLSRSQLVALCRVLEVQTLGTNSLLRFQLRMKLRWLAADDKMIEKEGLPSLNLAEVQQACRARGMRAYGVSEARLRSQLAQWLDLSLNKKVPPSLLLLSRALMLPETIPTEDKLKATISALPETIINQTKAAIAEKEGKIYNKFKLEVMKEEERKVQEERLEISEDSKNEIKEGMVDVAPIISADKTPILEDKAKVISVDGGPKEDIKIVTKDLEAIQGALSEMSKEKLLVEKEELSELKAEMADYQEDVQDFKKVVADLPKQDIKVSHASQLLQNKVNKMINKMDTIVTNLEEQKMKLKDDDAAAGEKGGKTESIVKIEDILSVIKKIQNVHDDARLEQIQKVLVKMDDDCDGSINVEDVLKVIEFIGKDSVKLNDKQVDELLEMLNKEEILEVEHKIEKALKKEKDMQATQTEAGVPPEVGPQQPQEKMEVSKTSSSSVPKPKQEAQSASVSHVPGSIDPVKKKSQSKVL